MGCLRPHDYTHIELPQVLVITTVRSRGGTVVVFATAVAEGMQHRFVSEHRVEGLP